MRLLQHSFEFSHILARSVGHHVAYVPLAVIHCNRRRRPHPVVPPAPRRRRHCSLVTGRGDALHRRRRHFGLQIQRHQLTFESGDSHARRLKLPLGGRDFFLAVRTAAVIAATATPFVAHVAPFPSLLFPLLGVCSLGAPLQTAGHADTEERAPVQFRWRVGRRP